MYYHQPGIDKANIVQATFGDKDNAIEIVNNECDNCDSTVTLSSTISLCLTCISDLVIYHQAKQSWLETNGDPAILALKKIDELKQELADLKKEIQTIKNVSNGGK